jgi:hypothetical protein
MVEDMLHLAFVEFDAVELAFTCFLFSHDEAMRWMLDHGMGTDDAAGGQVYHQGPHPTRPHHRSTPRSPSSARQDRVIDITR